MHGFWYNNDWQLENIPVIAIFTCNVEWILSNIIAELETTLGLIYEMCQEE